MANSKKSILIGVIAEDNSDVDVVKEILGKYSHSGAYKVKKYAGGGCGSLQRKCGEWAKLLVAQGCKHLLVVHDRDRHEREFLRRTLRAKIPIGDFPNSLVVIPVEEIEAWLLADERALGVVFETKRPFKRIQNPEAVQSPKEMIGRIVDKSCKKIYVNTAHNLRLAKAAELQCLRRCPSFVELDEYLKTKVFVRPH